MSEEQNPTTPLINNEITKRLNSAYIASDFTLLNGGSDNIVMISGEKNGEKIDLLVTYDALEQIVQDLKKEVTLKNNE